MRARTKVSFKLSNGAMGEALTLTDQDEWGCVQCVIMKMGPMKTEIHGLMYCEASWLTVLEEPEPKLKLV